MTIVEWFLVLVGVLLSALGGIFLKLGAVKINHDDGLLIAFSQVVVEWRIYLGAIFYFVPVMIWIYLLKKIEITYLQPLFALVYIITPLLSIFVFGESMHWNRWAGVFLILVGIIFVAQK